MSKKAPSALADTITSISSSDAAYDQNMKKLLANKQIIARILKYTLEEFSEYEIDEIMRCIGRDIEISTRPVDPGLTNLENIKSEATEDSVLNEGIIWYDIRFTVTVKKKKLRILVNIESQKTSDYKKLGYHLENRIVFYLSRMISAQKTVEFEKSDYDDIKPVRSIWLIMDSEEKKGSIEKLGLESKMMFGRSSQRCHTDLMNAVIVRISRKNEKSKSENELISLLEDIIRKEPANQKIESLESHGLAMSNSIRRDIRDMCNVSQAIREDAYLEGEKAGEKRGEKRAEERFLKLVEELSKMGRIDDLKKLKDQKFKTELYKEFNI